MTYLFKGVLFLSDHDDSMSLFMTEFKSNFVGVTSDLLSFNKVRLKKYQVKQTLSRVVKIKFLSG